MRTPEHKRSVKNGTNSDSVKAGSEMCNNTNKAAEYQDNTYNHEVSQSQPNEKGIVKDGRTGRSAMLKCKKD